MTRSLALEQFPYACLKPAVVATHVLLLQAVVDAEQLSRRLQLCLVQPFEGVVGSLDALGDILEPGILVALVVALSQ